MSKLRFSVLTAVYNEEKLVIECIESVLNQTYSDFELILINDGSSDNSGQIIDSYAEKDSRIVAYHQENKGPIIARQKAISLAKGEYCIFVDSDDFIETNLLETLNESINNTHCDLYLYKWYDVYNDYKRAQDGVFKHNSLFNESNIKDFYRKLITVNVLNSLCIKAIKTDILKSIKRDPDFIWIRRAEDLYTSLEIFTKAKTIHYLDVALYNYRTTNDKSMTKKFDPTIFKSDNAVRQEEFRYMSLWGIDDANTVKTFFNWYIKNVLRLMKGAFMLGISIKQKKALLNEIIANDFMNKALNYADNNYFSRLNKLEVWLLKRKSVNGLLFINSVIFNRYIAKPIIYRAERRNAGV